jgi:CDP-glycerol glycerophosphotransferase
MYDLDEYQNNTRDFYISLDELPGPIIKEEQALSDAIGDITNIRAEYDEKYKAFNDKFNYLDDANASKRVVETCIKI